MSDPVDGNIDGYSGSKTEDEVQSQPRTAQKGDRVPRGTQSDDDILEEARDRRKQCEDAEAENYPNAIDDLLFLSGGLNQWDPLAAQIRTQERRPCLTVNNLPTFLHQVTNEQRQNKPAVKVHPVDDDADVETAEINQGLIRHIEYDSNASVAYARAVNSAAAIGFGWFRLVTEFESPDSFDQKIMYKSVRNALSVHIDPLSQEPDGSDMKFCFIESKEPRKEFERQYPDAGACDTSLIGNTNYQGWLTTDTVTVCEYYRLVEAPAVLCQMADGTAMWEDEVPKAMEPLIKRRRDSYRPKVEWYKITCTDVLERTEIKCKWIPVFPVYGDEIDINGRIVRSGIIRNAKDPFRMYNYWITLATEEVALRPKAPFIAAAGQTEQYPEWQTANARSYSVLPYDPVSVEGVLAPPPQRQHMADIPTGALAMMMHAADNKKATTGLFDSSLGARGTATSGIQEREQQQQGDVANFHYTDNLNITVRHVGRCLLSMIPHYYDAARTVRILGEDDTAKQAKINQPVEVRNPKTGQVEMVERDLTKGQYDLTISSGPSYSTKRQEAAEFLTAAMQAAKDPASAAVITYLAFRNQDMAGAQEATAMLKKLLPPQVQEPEEGEEPTVATPRGPVPVSQAGAVIEEMSVALQNADRMLDESKMLAEKNKAAELELKAREVQVKEYEAQTDRMRAEADAQKANADALKAQADAANAAAEAVKGSNDAQAEAEAQRFAEAARLAAQEAETRAKLEADVVKERERIASDERKATEKLCAERDAALEKAALEAATKIITEGMRAKAVHEASESPKTERQEHAAAPVGVQNDSVSEVMREIVVMQGELLNAVRARRIRTPERDQKTGAILRVIEEPET